MTEIPLSALKDWYEENVARTSTLEMVRCIFQGNFPAAPTSALSSLGENWSLFKELRKELGDNEFYLYLQCQIAAFKEHRKDKPFYPSYCVEEAAIDRYLERREKVMHSGYYSFRSEIYRVAFPSECTALREYFRCWLRWSGGGEEPNWPDIKASFADRGHPFWVTFSCNYETAVDRGAEFCEIWIAGKKRLRARKLLQDSNEYDRACIDALAFTALQITSRAEEFTVLPLESFSFAYQIAVQLYELRKEIRSPALPLRISVGDGNEKIYGIPS